MIRAIGLALAALLLAAPAGAAPRAQVTSAAMRDEVIYHIFFRSFRDSNGDRIGDLEGLTAGLNDIKALGVTSLLLTPIQPSPYYHNYFATDFAGIDPAYGTMEDFHAFVRAAHARGLRVYLDEEFQYVAEGHPWLTSSRGRPGAPFGRYILYDRPKTNEEPEPFLGVPAWPGHDGRWIGISMVNLKSPAVRAYFARLLVHWVDPHGDGSLRDGVDGFRIDHMMDDLDDKHRLTDLFADFWAPIFSAIRARNPAARIIAEQADWGPGDAWLTRGGADMVFAFPLRFALEKMDKTAIVKALRASGDAPEGQSRILFLENHDLDRFVSVVGDDRRKARIGAALTLLMRGTPSIYYGQELGMRGRIDPRVKSDGAHIGLREAYRWSGDLEATGSAIWYRTDATAWTNRFNRSNDGVSLAEERDRPDSLYTFYRTLLVLRAARPELRQGDQRILCDDDSTAVCVLRSMGGRRVLVLANSGAAPVRPNLPAMGQGWTDLLDGDRAVDPMAIELPPYGMRVLGAG
ncbi:MAG: alpha-amylase family glycosyl hydrolase [Sphingomonas sp.]|uniref:alpha-amylase family glycosyl hydrolase n=1 Tax=Sphingomonas sp. TaxID=28214 RepID=UPI003F7DE0AA